jgi:hypothetical protein
VFDNVRAAMRREKRGNIDWALSRVREAVELVMHEYDKAQVRASEHGLLPGDEELPATEFLDDETIAIFHDLEDIYDRIGEHAKVKIAEIPFEIDSSR